MQLCLVQQLRKAIEDVNSGVSLAFHRYSLSSQGECGEFDLQGVSPGAPKDIETGTRQTAEFEPFALLISIF